MRSYRFLLILPAVSVVYVCIRYFCPSLYIEMPKELIYNHNNVCKIEDQLGTKGYRSIEAEELYKRAALLMEQKLGFINEMLDEDAPTDIGEVNMETYILLKRVIHKYPETESAINAQIKLAILCSPDMKGNKDDAYISIILLKQIQNNYPNTKKSIYAGYLERTYMIDMARALYIKNDPDVLPYVNELADYENAIIKYNKMSDYGVEPFMNISNNDYYTELAFYYFHYGCDPKKARYYISKLNKKEKAQDDRIVALLRMLNAGCKCSSTCSPGSSGDVEYKGE